jgi:hypothetical protein
VVRALVIAGAVVVVLAPVIAAGVRRFRRWRAWRNWRGPL